MKKLLYSMIIVLAMALFMVGFSACNNSADIPTYEGMTIVSQTKSIPTNTMALKSAKKGNGNNPWEDRPGWKPGDGNPHTDYDEEEPEEPEQDIDDIVEIDIVDDGEIKYYVTPGEVFIIQVHLSNPKQYEIQSFTLNGVKYANYMFEEGSTMELLLLEVTAPMESGYTEYTIDAIKYIDGTEIKDVRFEGDKTIKAGIAYTQAPSAVLVSKAAGTTTADVQIDITDNENVIGETPVKLYLSDGENVIKEKELIVGQNDIQITDLLMGKTYEIGVATYYDMIDGNGNKEAWLLKDTITTEKAFSITEATIYQSQMEFTVEKLGEVGQITAIELIDKDSEEVVDSLSDFTQTWFTGLLSNHAYKVKVSFDYTSNNQTVSDYTEITFQTAAKTVPTVELANVTATQTAIGFEIDTVDVDNILQIESIELLQNDTVVKALEDLTERQFTNVLSDNEYTVKVTYTYDLNDGTGAKEAFATYNIKTIEKSQPQFFVEYNYVTENTVAGNIKIEDIDGVSNEIILSLLLNGETLFTADDYNSFEFENLEAYTEYTLQIAYRYDLNNGIGEQHGINTFTFITNPLFTITSYEVINTNAVSEGETIYLQVGVSNPYRAICVTAKINGIDYNVSKASSDSLLYIEIVNKGQFAGGATELVIEEMKVEIDGHTFAISPQENNVGEVFIYGKLTVNNIDFTDSAYQIVDYGGISKDYFVHINLNNPTGYEIYEVQIGYSINGFNHNIITISNRIIAKDRNNIYFSFILNEEENLIEVISLKYRLKDVDKKLLVDSNPVYPNVVVYGYNDTTVYTISTPDDLLDMDKNGYYVLANDIDLAGLEWKGENFSGFFEGNGHKILNMGVVSTFETGVYEFGLFEYGKGVIQNLTIENAKYLVTLNMYNGNVNFGAIVASGSVVLSNCHLKNSVISFISKSEKLMGDFGGLIGYSAGNFRTILYNCTNNSNISLSSFVGSSNVGGLVGVGGKFIDCYNLGYISGKFYVGGLAGQNGEFINSYNKGEIKGNSAGGLSGGCGNAVNCYNEGKVIGERYVGGIIAFTDKYWTDTIEGCTNYGTISGNEYVGGILGRCDCSHFSDNNFTFKNCINKGTVIGKSQVGALTGDSSLNVINIDSSNEGEVIIG